MSYNYYTEAGVGFARHTYETLDGAGDRQRATRSRTTNRRRVANGVGPAVAAARGPAVRRSSAEDLNYCGGGVPLKRPT